MVATAITYILDIERKASIAYQLIKDIPVEMKLNKMHQTKLWKYLLTDNILIAYKQYWFSERERDR